MIEIKGDTAFTLDQWREALGAAEGNEFCPIDTREGGGEVGALGAWICDELYGSDKAGKGRGDVKGAHVTERIIDGALAMLEQEEWTAATPDRIETVIRSYRGETGTDFEKLARDYAETDYIGPEDENPAASGWEGFGSEHDFERWYVDNGTSEGEVCGEIAEGGTLIWFDKFKW